MIDNVFLQILLVKLLQKVTKTQACSNRNQNDTIADFRFLA